MEDANGLGNSIIGWIDCTAGARLSGHGKKSCGEGVGDVVGEEGMNASCWYVLGSQSAHSAHSRPSMQIVYLDDMFRTTFSGHTCMYPETQDSLD